MTTSFIRGVRFIEIPQGSRSVPISLTSVLGLIGTAPIHTLPEEDQHRDRVMLILNEQDAAKYLGPDLPGYTLRPCAQVRDDFRAGPMLVVNVFDPARHLETFTGALSFVGDTLQLPSGTKPGEFNSHVLAVEGTAVYSSSLKLRGADRLVQTVTLSGDTVDLGDTGAVVLALTSTDGATTYVEGTDYTVANGVITRDGGGAIAADALLRAVWEVGDDVVTLPRSQTDVITPTGDDYDTGETNPDIVRVLSADRSVSYALGTDYTVDGGTVTRVDGGGIVAGVKLRITYTKVALASVKSPEGPTYALGTDYTVDDGIIARVPTGVIPPNSILVVEYTEPDVLFSQGRDYTVDADAGTLTRVTAGLHQRIAPNASVSVTYEYPLEPSITDIVGTTTADGVRSGMQTLLTSFIERGFNPSLLGAPGFTKDETVAQELAVLAERLRAIAAIDAPVGLTVQQALESRGESGEAAAFFTTSPRIKLLYPNPLGFNAAKGKVTIQPYSKFWLAAASRTDIQYGYWRSPSNQPLIGVQGFERSITSINNDPTSETDILTGAGITTYRSDFAAGYVTWGSHSASFPNSDEPEDFIAVRRTIDVIQSALERAVLKFIDAPLSEVLINVPNTVNPFLASQVALGALIAGRCFYDQNINNPTDLARGIIRFQLILTPNSPVCEIVLVQTIDKSELASLGTLVAA